MDANKFLRLYAHHATELAAVDHDSARVLMRLAADAAVCGLSHADVLPMCVRLGMSIDRVRGALRVLQALRLIVWSEDVAVAYLAEHALRHGPVDGMGRLAWTLAAAKFPDCTARDQALTDMDAALLQSRRAA